MKDSNYFLHNMLSYVLRTNIYIFISNPRLKHFVNFILNNYKDTARSFPFYKISSLNFIAGNNPF